MKEELADITINTGYIRVSARDEVGARVIDKLLPLVRAQAGVVPTRSWYVEINQIAKRTWSFGIAE